MKDFYKKRLQEVADYPTGRFVDNRSHPMVDGNWTTTHLGEHKGHPSKTTVTSTIDRLPGWKSGKPSPGPVRTTYSIATRYGPTTNDGKRYKFKTKPIVISHVRPHHLVGSEDLVMDDVHPTIRNSMLNHIRNHDNTLHPESPNVTELSSGRVLPQNMGGGSLTVGTAREYQFSKRGPMDEGFADTIYDPNAPSLMKSMKSDSPAITFGQKVCSDIMGRCGKSSNVASENPSVTPPVGPPATPPVGQPVGQPATPQVNTPVTQPVTPNPTKPTQPYSLTKLATRVKPIRVKPIRLKEVTTGTGRPIDIEQGERLGNLKDSLKRKLEMERSSGIEDNATYKDAPHAFRRQDSTRDKLIRIQQFMSAKGGNKNATKASNDNRTNRNAYRNYYKK